jgi:hypothetical protein
LTHLLADDPKDSPGARAGTSYSFGEDHMNINRWLGAIVLAACLINATHAQQPGYTPAFPPPSPLAPRNGMEIPPEAFTANQSGLSDWILYKRDCCEGRHGKLTPLYTEVYLRVGPSFPVGGQTLSRELVTGWSIAGGARALFFNEPQTRAWVVDAHIINTHEGGVRDGTEFPITIFRAANRFDFGVDGVPGVTVKDSTRTMVGLGFGREFYLWQPADCEGRKWRVGVDAGGRYGSHRLVLNETRYITDVIGGIYVAGHSDVEVPCGRVMWHAGMRLEWAYTWSDVLHRTSDVQDINLLLTMGVRY